MVPLWKFYSIKRSKVRGPFIPIFFFILGVEVLSYMPLRAEEEGMIHGAKVARGARSISHLYFANDNLLFCQATIDEGKELRGILEDYCMISGQQVNLGKSGTYFSKVLASKVQGPLPNHWY